MSVVWFTFWTLALLSVITFIKVKNNFNILTKDSRNVFFDVNSYRNSIRRFTLSSAR